MRNHAPCRLPFTMTITADKYLTGKCLARKRRPAPQCSTSPAEMRPRWPRSGTGNAAGRSSAVEAVAGSTSGFYTGPRHCCSLEMFNCRIHVMNTQPLAFISTSITSITSILDIRLILSLTYLPLANIYCHH